MVGKRDGTAPSGRTAVVVSEEEQKLFKMYKELKSYKFARKSKNAKKYLHNYYVVSVDGKEISDKEELLFKLFQRTKISASIEELNDILDKITSEMDAADDSVKAVLTKAEAWDEFLEHFDPRPGGVVMVKEPFDWDPYLVAHKGHAVRTDVIEQVFEEFLEQKQLTHSLQFTTPVMRNGLRYAIETRQKEIKDAVFETLRYDSSLSADDLFGYLIEQAHIENAPTSLKVLKHFLWSVKRLHFYPDAKIQDPVFPVFVGPQGCGKSQTVKRLCSPIHDYTNFPTLEDLGDERIAAVDANTFNVLVFDELSKAEQKAVREFKKWVTSDEQVFRPMRTNTRQKLRKLAQGIATSNDPIEDLLVDYTGNRRAFEVRIVTPVNHVFDFIKEGLKETEFNGEFWYKLWRSIDETLERGYYNSNVDNDVREEMNAAVGKGPVHYYVKEVLLNDGVIFSNEELKFMSTAEVYDSFVEYMKKSSPGKHPIPKTRFAKMLPQQLIYFDAEDRLQAKHTSRGNGYMVPRPGFNKEKARVINTSARRKRNG